MWNKTERDGKIDQIQGKLKQAVGAATKDDDLKAEGQADEIVGNVESMVGRTSRKAGEAITRAADAAKGKKA